MFIERVCTELNKHNVTFAIVGGHAVALHGAVRGTIDIDFTVQWSEEHLRNTELALNNLGLQSRLPITADDVFKHREEYIEKRNLIAWNFFNPDRLDEQVDVIINYDLSSDEIDNLEFNETTIPVLKLSSLLNMKRKSGRQQDLADVEALERLSK